MENKSLEQTPLKEIVAAFNSAFADYFVPISATEEAMANRWRAGRVDYSLSFGAFHRDELAGFIITGVDQLNGLKTAYNAGTGVLPAFRGQKLVAQLYRHALPKFREAGIQQSTLEVICQNHKAIKAYQNVGFGITRTLHCFRGQLKTTNGTSEDKDFRLERTSTLNPELLAPLQPYDFSWDNRNEGISQIKADLETWCLYHQKELAAYLILNPETGYLAQLGFKPETREQAAEILFGALEREIPVVRINNVDSRAPEIASLLLTAGLENHLDQYEMLLRLN